MGFMEPQRTNRQEWIAIDGDCGTTYVPRDVAPEVAPFDNGEGTDAQKALAAEYYEGNASRIWSVEITEGYGVRLSAPGFLDCTDWSVYDTEEEADKAVQELEEEEN